MKTFERFDFREEYGISPNRFMQMNEGDSVKIERKNQPARVIKVEKIIGTRTCRNSMVLSENGEEFLLDLSPHWERGSSDIKCCHQGVMNLIGAVYRQAENDYEELWIKGIKGYATRTDYLYMKKTYPLMNYAEYVELKTQRYKAEIEELEGFMGTIYTMYAKVRACWRHLSHDPKVIAERTGLTADHVVKIIDRLGLNRPD